MVLVEIVFLIVVGSADTIVVGSVDRIVVGSEGGSVVGWTAGEGPSICALGKVGGGGGVIGVCYGIGGEALLRRVVAGLCADQSFSCSDCWYLLSWSPPYSWRRWPA